MQFASIRHTIALVAVLATGLACSSGADPVVPTSISVTNGSIVFTEIGATATITPVVRDQRGELIPDAVFTYESSNPAVATVSAQGVVTAEGAGGTVVTVRSGELSTAVGVTVEITVDGTLTIRKDVRSWFGGDADSPADPPLSGFEFEVRAVGASAPTATVTTNASGFAQVDVGPGNYVVTESNSLGLTDFTSSVTAVVPNGGDFSLEWVNRQLPATNAPAAVLNASPVAVPAGDNNQTEVRLWAGNSADPNGDALTYAWEAPGGTFIGATTGREARVTFPGGSSQTVTLTVDDGNGNQAVAQQQIAGPPSLPAAGNFDIELVPIEPIEDADAQAAFDLAEATWESIIRNDLPDIQVNLTASQVEQCFDGAPAINESIDDVRIYIEFSNIDGQGGTFASAGPCFIRVPPGGDVTPIFGVMSFDSSDFGNQPASVLNQVILHEMAHVLGFGTLWNRNGLIENPSCADDCTADDPPGPDTRFIGPQGSGAYQALGGLLGSDVPVENGQGVSAGPGSRDGHWREVIFGTELMTGFIQTNVTNPLSILTVASLIDMGYQVDFSEVDNYEIPGSPPFPAAALNVTPIDDFDLRDDVRDGPILGIRPDGSVVRVDGRR